MLPALASIKDQDRRKLGIALGIFVLFVLSFGYLFSGSRGGGAPGIHHIVAFKAESHLDSLTSSFLALQKGCTRNGHTYIRSITGGKQSSPEGLDGAMQVVFVVEFKTQADLDYYISHDPAHAAFKDAIKPYAPTATVLDFTPGVY